MFVYPVSYRIRSDKVLVRNSVPSSCDATFLTFDDYYQAYSGRSGYLRQMEDSVIHCVKNATFSMFFVFGKEGTLHLFNSRAEVTRFLRSLKM